MMRVDRALSLLDASRRKVAQGPIGFELGPEMLHMLQLEERAEGMRIRAALSVPYPGDRETLLAAPSGLKALVRKGLKSRPFRGRRTVSAMPAADVKLMVLNYELRPQQSEPQRILRLVEERVSEATESLVVDYLPIRMIGEKEEAERTALVVVASREAVMRHLERLRAAGLEIGALEIAPVAVRRLVSQTLTSSQQNALVIHCGREKSHLTVLWGRRLILYREIDFGEKQAIEELSKALEMTSPEAASLLHRYGVHPAASGDPATDDPAGELEISQTIMEILKPSFYGLAEHVDKGMVYTASKSRGSSPDRVYLLGNIARWPRADRLLQSLLSIPVRILDPRDVFPLGPRAATPADLEPSGEVALAAGLALRGMQEDG